MRSNLNSSDSTGSKILPLNYTPYTKFFIPNSGVSLIIRKDIDLKLTEAMKKKLIIINAPAGYGKSTVVSSWALQNKDDKNLAWINLDKEDSEEKHFWHNVLYAINCCNNIVPDHSIPSFSTEQSINLIINYYTGISSDGFIIFDDFHNVDYSWIHKSFEYFLAYMPKNVHCILISRTFPALPISKMEIDDVVAVLVANDLRFSIEEIRYFLNEVMEFRLSEEDIQNLEAKTEGWAAALKVVALSLKNCNDKSAMIRSFDNNNKRMFQYMLEEVVNYLEAPVKEFLLKTSILKTLNRSICDALIGSDSSQDILEILEKNSIFIMNMDQEKENYRYHHLLSDMMKKLLLREYPEQIDELFLTASRWCEAQGYYQEALEYSVASKNPNNTLEILKNYFNTGNQQVLGPKSICNYFETIPCEMYNKMPELCIHYALALGETGDLTPDVKELIKRGIYLDSEVFKDYEGQVCQIRAYIALKYENTADIIRYSEQALKELPETNVSCITLCLILGYIYRSLGELKQAESYFSNALAISKESEELIILSSFYMTSIKYLTGNLDDFITPLNKMLGQNITHKNCMYFCLATTYYDYADFEKAYINVIKGLELCNTYDDIFYEKVKGFVLLAKILFHTGKIDEAKDVMNQIDSLVRPDCGNMFVLLELPGIVNMLVLLGLTDRAEAYIRKFTEMRCKEAECMLGQAQAELSLGLNDYEYAIDRLMLILTNMDLAVYPKKRIDLLILLSITYHAYGKDEDALEYLQQALETKGAQRNISAFINRGKPMQELLTKLINRAKRNNIELTTIAEKLVARLKNKAVLKGYSIEDFERLSGREMEVLRLLAQGFSYEEIGRTLFISLSTVKKHTSNIYYKLKAGNKIQAVNIAKANGLVG